MGVGADGSGFVKQLSDALAAGGHPGLGPDTTYIHSCTLTDEELDLIEDTGGGFWVAGPIEMQMGHGIPPIQRALDRGIPISLSVDVETNQPTDMFTQMRSMLRAPAWAQERRAPLPLRDPRPGPGGASRETADHPRRPEARDDRRREGEWARPQGRHAHAGKEADIVLLDAAQINVAPFNNATGAVVLAMDTTNVDSVLVAGKFVKRNGKLVGVNVDRLLHQAQTSTTR